MAAYMERALRDPGGYKSLFYDYEPNGPLGIPQLTLRLPIEYVVDKGRAGPRVPISQHVALSGMACACLDVEARQAGAWGPECRIAKFLKRPAGRLVVDTTSDARHGDYVYTPPRIGTDTARYILENGADKKVDVIVKLEARRG